jgi:hypothetical protein
MTRFSRLKGLDAVVARYGSVRSFVLRTLYTWLTLTILALFTWPLLIIYADAPAVAPQDTPLGWFQFRLLAPTLVAVAAAWLWQLSPAPTDTGAVRTALSLFQRGRVWPQVLVFLLGTIAVITIFLLIEDPAGALKLVSVTCAEAAVIGIIISGYLHATFDVVLEDDRANLAAVGLFALTFVIRGVVAIASESDVTQAELIGAGIAGLIGGALIGGVTTFLRVRSGSIAPGILSLWLLFLVLGLSGFYGQ